MKMCMSLNLTGHFFHKEAELYQKIEPSYLDYGNTCCGVFNGGIQNLKGFWLKINIPKGNYRILRIGVVASCQKLDIILENKVI